MKLRNAVFAAMLLALSPGVSVQAAQSTAGAGDQASAGQVRELMDVVGTKRLMTQMMGQMTVMLSRAFPCVPQTTLSGAFNNPKNEDELISRMVPIYQQHFTRGDINGLLAFYRSPLGQKLVQAQPQIMQQGMQIGRQWGEEHAKTMIAQLKQQGVLDAQGQCKAAQKPVVPGSSS